MNCCNSKQCTGIESVFDLDMARGDLKRYQKRGPARETQILIAEIKKLLTSFNSLLDIGGGVGAIQHELAFPEVNRIVNVDASLAYSRVAQEEAVKRGYAEHAQYLVGDFVELAPSLDAADVVTLDRVICCYDRMPDLVEASIRKADHLYAIVLPRNAWWVRLGIWGLNLAMWVSRNGFRVFAHPISEVKKIILNHGFTPVFSKRTLVWQILIFKNR